MSQQPKWTEFHQKHLEWKYSRGPRHRFDMESLKTIVKTTTRATEQTATDTPITTPLAELREVLNETVSEGPYSLVIA